MDPQKSIYWHEGLFLRPQHFQQQDYSQQSFSYGLVKQISPFHWGLNSLSIVTPVLNNHIFEIEQCEIVFPDGAHVFYPGNATIERRSIEGEWGATGKPISVYLGIRKLTAGKSNISALVDDLDSDATTAMYTGTRYCVSDVPNSSPDFYAEDKYDDVYYLQHNIQIFINEEASKAVDFTLIKIAELQRVGSEVSVSRHYIPPILNIGASTVMLDILRDINEQITTQGRSLALYKQDTGIDGLDYGSKDIIYMMALQTLNRYIPMLRHSLEGGIGTPWSMYGLVRQLAGELSTFSAKYDVFGNASRDSSLLLPEYKHDEIVESFSTVSRLITNLINELMAGPDYIVSLPYDGTYFESKLDKIIFQGANRFYLCVQTGWEDDQAIQSLETLSKLSSRQRLPILIARALSSVGLEHDPSPPTELPRSANRLYFKINNHGDAWEAVKESINLAIYLESPPDDMEIELMVIYG